MSRPSNTSQRFHDGMDLMTTRRVYYLKSQEKQLRAYICWKETEFIIVLQKDPFFLVGE